MTSHCTKHSHMIFTIVKLSIDLSYTHLHVDHGNYWTQVEIRPVGNLFHLPGWIRNRCSIPSLRGLENVKRDERRTMWILWNYPPSCLPHILLCWQDKSPLLKKIESAHAPWLHLRCTCVGSPKNMRSFSRVKKKPASARPWCRNFEFAPQLSACQPSHNSFVQMKNNNNNVWIRLVGKKKLQISFAQIMSRSNMMVWLIPNSITSNGIQ